MARGDHAFFQLDRQPVESEDSLRRLRRMHHRRSHAPSIASVSWPPATASWNPCGSAAASTSPARLCPSNPPRGRQKDKAIAPRPSRNLRKDGSRLEFHPWGSSKAPGFMRLSLPLRAALWPNVSRAPAGFISRTNPDSRDPRHGTSPLVNAGISADLLARIESKTVEELQVPVGPSCRFHPG